jgi:ribulose-5-phosphate 4-epimerase/fuculose-1-phosphate aldolase
MDSTLRYLPLGVVQITALSAAKGLTVPAGANVAVIIPEAQAVVYAGSLSTIEFIEQTASAKLNVAFYKIRG